MRPCNQACNCGKASRNQKPPEENAYCCVNSLCPEGICNENKEQSRHEILEQGKNSALFFGFKQLFCFPFFVQKFCHSLKMPKPQDCNYFFSGSVKNAVCNEQIPFIHKSPFQGRELNAELCHQLVQDVCFFQFLDFFLCKLFLLLKKTH